MDVHPTSGPPEARRVRKGRDMDVLIFIGILWVVMTITGNAWSDR